MRFPKTYVDEACVSIANPELDHRLNFQEFVASCMDRDPSRAMENRRRKNPDWPVEWLEGAVRLRWLCDGNGWLVRGTARRIVSNDIREFQLFLEMHVRSRFHSYCKNEDEYVEIWPLLVSLAIDDRVAEARYLDIASFPLKNSRGGEAARLFNVIHQLLREPGTRVSDLDLRTTKGCAVWLRSCLRFVKAFVERNRSEAEDTLNDILQGFRKSPQINLMEKAIAFCALGLYRVCDRVAPDLGLPVPTDSNLPWDSKLYNASADRQAISRIHFDGVPEWLCGSIVDLRPLPWQSEG